MRAHSNGAVEAGRKRRAPEGESAAGNAMERARSLEHAALLMEKWGCTETAAAVSATAKSMVRCAGTTTKSATSPRVWQEERARDILEAAVLLGAEGWDTDVSRLLDEADRSLAADVRSEVA